MLRFCSLCRLGKASTTTVLAQCDQYAFQRTRHLAHQGAVGDECSAAYSSTARAANALFDQHTARNHGVPAWCPRALSPSAPGGARNSSKARRRAQSSNADCSMPLQVGRAAFAPCTIRRARLAPVRAVATEVKSTYQTSEKVRHWSWWLPSLLCHEPRIHC